MLFDANMGSKKNHIALVEFKRNNSAEKICEDMTRLTTILNSFGDANYQPEPFGIQVLFTIRGKKDKNKSEADRNLFMEAIPPNLNGFDFSFIWPEKSEVESVALSREELFYAVYACVIRKK